jgi:hypothetical protein
MQQFKVKCEYACLPRLDKIKQQDDGDAAVIFIK